MIPRSIVIMVHNVVKSTQKQDTVKSTQKQNKKPASATIVSKLLTLLYAKQKQKRKTKRFK